MKFKVTQSIPLISAFIALVLGGIVLFTLTPADAMLAAETDPINEQVKNTTGAVKEENLDTVEHMYLYANQDVVLDKHYLNDVFVAGNTVTVTGTIEGDLFVAGGTVIVDGDVNGSLRAAGSTVTIKQSVGRNLVVFGNQVTIAKTAHVGQDVTVQSNTLDVNGTVNGDVTVTANELNTGNTASILGEVHHTKPEEQNNNQTAPKPDVKKPLVTVFQVIKLMLGWLGYVILGIVLLKLFPKNSNTVIQRMKTAPGKSLLYGIGILVLAPAVLLTLAITLVGLPLATMSGLVLLVVLMWAKVLAGSGLGYLLLPQAKSSFGQFMLGFSMLYLVTGVMSWFGFFGWLLSCVVMVVAMAWAMGSLIQQYGRNL
ncbi:MAG: polymer-forming cytoskeletal protein [Patescibacteria group bacterium]